MTTEGMLSKTFLSHLGSTWTQVISPYAPHPEPSPQAEIQQFSELCSWFTLIHLSFQSLIFGVILCGCVGHPEVTSFVVQLIRLIHLCVPTICCEWLSCTQRIDMVWQVAFSGLPSKLLLRYLHKLFGGSWPWDVIGITIFSASWRQAFWLTAAFLLSGFYGLLACLALALG